MRSSISLITKLSESGFKFFVNFCISKGKPLILETPYDDNNMYETYNEELEKVHELYQKRYGVKDYDIAEMKKKDPEGRAYWVFKPNEIYTWDEVNFPKEPKQKFIP